MRAVVQRVTRASVRVDGEIVGSIDRGLSALVGVGVDDDREDAAALARKIVGLRVFSDAEDRMNLSLPEVGGALLAVSQFTLFGDVRKGKRPSFVAARAPDEARALFETFVEAARGLGVPVETGCFRAHMEVELVSDGPVTLLVDTKRLF